MIDHLLPETYEEIAYQHLPVAIMVIDMQGKCAYLNAAADALLANRAQATMLGRVFHDLVHPRIRGVRFCDAKTCPVSRLHQKTVTGKIAGLSMIAGNNRILADLHYQPLRREGRRNAILVTLLERQLLFQPPPKRLMVPDHYLLEALDRYKEAALVVDSAGDIVAANQTYQTLFGNEKSIVSGSKVSFGGALFKQNIKTLLRQDSSKEVSFDSVCTSKGGGKFAAGIFAKALPGGELEGIHDRILLVLTTNNRQRHRILNRQQKALLELAEKQSIARENLEVALRVATELSACTLNVDRVSIWLHSHDKSTIKCVDLYEMSSGRHSSGQEISRMDYQAYFDALEMNRTIAADDARTDPSTVEMAENYLVPNNITSMMDVPIRREGRVIGVLCHEHVGAQRHWLLEEQHFASSVGDLVSLSMETWELRKAETRLKQSEQRIRLLLDSTGEAIYGINNDGEFTFANRSCLRIFNLSGQRGLLGRRMSEMLKCETSGGRIIEAGEHRDKRHYDDARITCVNGTTFPAEIWFAPIWQNKKHVGTVVTFIDISQRKKDEYTLRRSKEALAEAQQIAQLGNWEWDVRAGVFNCSDEVYRIFGLIPQSRKLRLKDFLLFLHDQERAGFVLDLKRRRKNSEPFCRDFLLQVGSGERYVRVKSSSIPAGSRVVAGVGILITGTIQDITDYKITEQELVKYRDRLEDLVKERTTALENANRELEAFSYSVSHDLRAPLRSINGFSQALMEDCLDRMDEAGKDYISRIQNSSNRMGRLIDDLLKLSRVSRQPLQKKPVDLSAIAREVVRNIESTDPGAESAIDVQEGMTAMCDSSLVQLVIDNLLRNAWKFSRHKQSPSIKFGKGINGDIIHFFVRDNGVGFDANHAGKLFGAFQRLHSEEEFEGTGIGLATVSRVINRHGGSIWAEGVVNMGATFCFTLP